MTEKKLWRVEGTMNIHVKSVIGMKVHHPIKALVSKARKQVISKKALSSIKISRNAGNSIIEVCKGG